MSATRTDDKDAWVRKALGFTPAPSRPGGGKRAQVTAKSRLAWVTARKQVEGDFAKLGDAIAAAYHGHPAAEHLEMAFRAKVGTMLDTLDHSLADKLDEVNNAQDAETREKLVQEAQQIIGRYEAYVAGDPMIAKLDDNPFVPVTIGRTLTATLAALRKAVR